jgi:soluble lytic murein transglycosylase
VISIFSQIYKYNLIARHFAVVGVLTILFFATESGAKDSRPMSQKLWKGLSEEDRATLKDIKNSIDDKKYNEALIQAENLKKENKQQDAPEKTQVIKDRPDFFEAAVNIILWSKYSNLSNPKNISFNDISRFSLDNSFYPNVSEISRNVEKVAIANSIPYKSSEKYFSLNPAATLESKLFLLESKIKFLSQLKSSNDEKEKAKKEAQTIISNIWLQENFSENEEKNFLQKYQNYLTQIDHINRIDRLLWDSKIADAKRVMHFVNEDYQSLFSAIIEIQNSPKYIDKIVLSVPRKLRSNEGLSYRRAIWYKSKDRIDDLLDIMVDLPEKVQFPEKWWSLRHLYAREMLKQKKYKRAYKLVYNHSLPTNASDFWEAEWFTGWVALRFINQPKEAYARFENLYRNVSQPVTLSRASYWLGMASEAMKNKEKAASWYKIAAQYPIFFYGQLAIHKHRAVDPIGAQEDIILPKDPDITVRDMIKMSSSRAAQVAYLLTIIGKQSDAGKVMEWLINNSASDGEVAVVMGLSNEIGDQQLDVKLSRVASKKNVFFIKDKFQIVKEISNDEYAPLIHAIVKQESGFAPSALSHVGAVGFMQVMPETAKLIAKDLGVPYDRNRLATDIKYNVRFGSHYIKKMIDRFDGSEMLAIASYNAGPNATQRWINEFYDPRKEEDLNMIVDWIELITYAETRNYVQRIMENLIVYKYLMSRANYDSIK